jgi:hypothetical protein
MKGLPTADETLVKILARRDAIFRPSRRFGLRCHANTNTFLMQRDFAANAGMLPWSSEKALASERVRSQRGIESLAEHGFVAVGKIGGRTARVGLTESGEIRAQALTSMPSLHDEWAWDLFGAVMRREGLPVPEGHLLPALAKAMQPESIAHWSRRTSLVFIEDCLLPFLVRRWVNGHGDVHGRARYRPGERHADAKKPIGDVPRFDEATRMAARHAYIRFHDLAYVELSEMEPSQPGEIGICPYAVDPATSEERLAWERSADLAARGE